MDHVIKNFKDADDLRLAEVKRLKEQRAAIKIQAIMRTIGPKKLLSTYFKCAKLIQSVSKFYLAGKHLHVKMQSIHEFRVAKNCMSGLLIQITNAPIQKPYVYCNKLNRNSTMCFFFFFKVVVTF